MPKSQAKGTNMDCQDNAHLPEVSNPITIGLKQCNLAEIQKKGFKIVIMDVFKDLKEYMNKHINEDCEITKS